MPKRSDGLHPVFKALGNATRQSIVERLSVGPAPVTELAAPFDMALPSFMQHLEVLEAAGLVKSQKHGRIRTVKLRPDRLQLAEGWLASQRLTWERRLDQLDSHLREPMEKN